MYRFLVVIEKGRNCYGAYSPDLPGCVATGKTRRQTERLMHEAICLHLQALREEGLPIPRQESMAEYVLVDTQNNFAPAVVGPSKRRKRA